MMDCVKAAASVKVDSIFEYQVIKDAAKEIPKLESFKSALSFIEKISAA
jgi:hypothetical protein